MIKRFQKFHAVVNHLRQLGNRGGADSSVDAMSLTSIYDPHGLVPESSAEGYRYFEDIGFEEWIECLKQDSYLTLLSRSTALQDRKEKTPPRRLGQRATLGLHNHRGLLLRFAMSKTRLR